MIRKNPDSASEGRWGLMAARRGYWQPGQRRRPASSDLSQAPWTWAISALVPADLSHRRPRLRPGNDARTGRRRDQDPRRPNAAASASRHRAALAGHARNLTGNHPGPGCGRNRRRARASPACHQLNHLSCGESRCGAARCYDAPADGGIRAGAAWSWPARCQRSWRPGKAPGTRLSAGASGRFARGTAMSPVDPGSLMGQQGPVGRTKRGWQTWTTGASAGAGSACR